MDRRAPDGSMMVILIILSWTLGAGMSGMGAIVTAGGAWAAARVRWPVATMTVRAAEGVPTRRFKAADGARERAE